MRRAARVLAWVLLGGVAWAAQAGVVRFTAKAAAKTVVFAAKTTGKVVKVAAKVAY